MFVKIKVKGYLGSPFESMVNTKYISIINLEKKIICLNNIDLTVIEGFDDLLSAIKSEE